MVASPDIEIQLESGFFQFFTHLPQDDLKLLRLFERGDNYSTHGKDAVFASETVYETSTVLKYYGGSKIPSCNLSLQTAQQFLKDLLLVKGFKIEIWCLEGKSWAVSKQVGLFNNDERQVQGISDRSKISYFLKQI